MCSSDCHKSSDYETNISLSTKDKQLLRRLAESLAEITASPLHKEKAHLWTNLNDLKSDRPMAWIDEICWHEMNVNDELTLKCETAWARQLEDQIRKTIYRWNHLPADMVVQDFLACPLVIDTTGFGLGEDVDIRKTDENNGVISRHFNIQIKEPEDIEKIKMPVITHNKQAMDIRFEYLEIGTVTTIIFDEDLDKRNKAYCAYLQALGELGLSQKEKAQKHLQTVLALNPNHSRAALMLALLNKSNFPFF